MLSSLSVKIKVQCARAKCGKSITAPPAFFLSFSANYFPITESLYSIKHSNFNNSSWKINHSLSSSHFDKILKIGRFLNPWTKLLLHWICVNQLKRFQELKMLSEIWTLSHRKEFAEISCSSKLKRAKVYHSLQRFAHLLMK